MDDRGIKSDGFRARGSTCGTIERSLSGSRQGARALQPLAIRQACLVPLTLSAPSHERKVNGSGAASGEEKFDLTEGIARFGDILNIDGPLIEIGSRSVFDNSGVGVRQ
jgi:hypothetical protein